ncbi:hypothetical protein E2C01_094332 [Portunus trituberculatus]|uniref:Uncharacterized protein n=1 Tax=Portunus trituberculatus TaxID=210409 RepID=A0A5B7JWW0_PORTR|nr:hypothetical protein [Portunus trituberculatus]
MVETTVARSNIRAALLEEADLVEWGEKTVMSIPAAPITSLTQHRNVSREANRTGGCIVRKKPVSDPRMELVLSR